MQSGEIVKVVLGWLAPPPASERGPTTAYHGKLQKSVISGKSFIIRIRVLKFLLMAIYCFGFIVTTRCMRAGQVFMLEKAHKMILMMQKFGWSQRLKLPGLVVLFDGMN